MTERIDIELPWPPTANSYWRRNGDRYFISEKGLIYRKQVMVLCFKHREHFAEDDRIGLSILAFPPDKRKRDIDNLLKSCIDSLQFAKVFKDDNQIDEIYVQRMSKLESRLEVRIYKITPWS